MSDSRIKKMSQVEKAAILLVSLGEETASDLLKKIPKADAQQILIAMSKVGRVDQSIVESLQGEFKSIIDSFKSPPNDGAETAKKIIDRAFSSEDSESFKRSLPRPVPHSFKLAEAAETKALWISLKRELPQTLAVIMAHLSPAKSADLAKHMPDDLRIAVFSCLAKTKEIHPDALDDIDEVLTKALDSAKNQTSHSIGGPKKTAEILSHLSPELRKQMLEKLEGSAPQMASEIKSGLFTFDDLIKIQPRDFEKILAKISAQELELALRRCPDSIANLFYKAMSSRRAEQTKENITAAKAVSVTKIDEAQRKIATIVTFMIESGEIFDPLDEVV